MGKEQAAQRVQTLPGPGPEAQGLTAQPQKQQREEPPEELGEEPQEESGAPEQREQEQP